MLQYVSNEDNVIKTEEIFPYDFIWHNKDKKTDQLYLSYTIWV